MKKYFSLTFVLAFILFPCFGMEDDKIENSQPNSSLSYQLRDFARQRLASFYYTTSVVGYDSYHEPMSDFLKNKFKEGWVQKEINSQRELPLSGEKGLEKIFDYISGYVPDEFNVTCLKQNSVYQYLYKEDANLVSIIVLNNVSEIIVETNQCNNRNYNHNHYTSYSWFDLSKSKSYNSSTSECLSQICDHFKNKSIKFHSLLPSEEPVSSNLATRVLSTFRGGSLSVIGHFCYAQITLNAERQSMEVRVIDPTFDTEQSYVKPIFGSLEPLPSQSEKMFKIIAENMGIPKLKHTYHYRADQVFNFHDCGLFSTIYLLSETAGRNALDLSNYDIYQGFKILKANGYHRYHETKTPTFPIPSVQSWISWVMGLRRTICDYILNKAL